MQEIIKNHISVVLAVCNGEKYLSEAIESILQQTYTDFELILVDDGSIDKTADIIEGYARDDKRIKHITNQENIGLAASLNVGIAHSCGEFIARMDADDIALPNRLEVQLKALKSNPALTFIGSNAEIINAEGQSLYTTNLFESVREVSALSLLFNCFIHPTVMIRSSALKNVKYNTEFDTTQDWAMWIDLISDGGKGANIEAPLLRQRHHDDSISIRKRNRQIENSLKIQKHYLRNMGGEEFWNLELFTFLNKYFLNDRDSFIKDGLSRPMVSLKILRYFKQIGKLLPDDERRVLRGFLVKRAVLIGMPPPLEAKYWCLVTHLLSSPIQLIKSILELIGQRNAK